MPGTVTVACRMPNGIRMRLYDLHEVTRQRIGGGTTTETMAHRRIRPNQPEEVILKGFTAPAGTMPPHPIVGGYGLTHNVDSDFFSEWMKQNADGDLVKNHIVFAHEKAEVVEKKAREHKNTLSGLEPLNTDTVFKGGVEAPVDVRWPHGRHKVQKATREAG